MCGFFLFICYSSHSPRSEWESQRTHNDHTIYGQKIKYERIIQHTKNDNNDDDDEMNKRTE